MAQTSPASPNGIGKVWAFFNVKTTTQSPSPALLKGMELILVVFKSVWRFSFPLGKAGMVLVAGEVSMMRERGDMVEMSASSSNSVGVAISQPRVAGEARYPG